MRYILNSREMATADTNTINKHGVPSMVLMERAALAVVKHIDISKYNKIIVVCGTGNNGADGLAIARLLWLKGADVAYTIVGDISKCSEQFGQQLSICKSYDIPSIADFEKIGDANLIIDAIFGIGLSRNLSVPYTTVIEKINVSNAKVISVDIPSGLSADDGKALGTPVKADITVTFGFEKLGHYLLEAKKYCGRLFVEDVGIDEKSLYDIVPKAYAFDASDLNQLKEPGIFDHKMRRGRLLVIAGSADMEGAAYLSSKAAMKTGIGIVTIYTHESNVQTLHTQFPEAIVKGYKTVNVDELTALMNNCDAILVGPGLSTATESVKIVETVLKYANCPMVIDADGLNIISQNMRLLDGIHPDIIITPHIGEMSRIVNESGMYISEHLLDVATEFANKYQITVVLKDFVTIVAHPYMSTSVNTCGNKGMATAGCGDVLAGIIAGLLAQGNSPVISSDAGVYIHSKAADDMVEYTGFRGLMASDILNGIDGVLNEF